ncbi:GntR family transcriptional regulator [Bacillus aquiflavi]|uniref:GntR family transcriptional regulator n=1 Tax=Bacillus aquiflavi TaxID=2672567 RepID=A0A6B3VU27_9BACI|nr:GntR family transcriptional regulator [Bacillus aquiflavi]MBA4537553.1 GntR family transcriptional regulator [Bacillus aquiflavi]NEY81810.1 GntR family transcriptional regulator [Bacillus aquiflavi]
MVDKNSRIPIYLQLEEQIKHQIEKGVLTANQMIPSEREYAQLYGISRMTVRHAINNLVLDGYLYRQKGRGTFVANRKMEQRLQGLTGFTEDMTERGLTPSSRLLSFSIIKANKQVANKLKNSLNTPVYELKRIRLADGEPMALETTYLPVNLVKGLTEEITHQSLYRYIEEELSFIISEARQQIEAATPTDDEISYLQIDRHTPVLLISRTSYLKDGTPFEYVKSAYRADRYIFVHSLKRE